MAYNYYPMNYQPYIPQTYNNPVTTQNNNSGLVWVQGEAGAKAYPVNAGNTCLLMDSESECFYLKTTDASGMPMPLRVFDYTERTVSANKPPEINLNNYVTREEFERKLAELQPVTSDKKELIPYEQRTVQSNK